MFAHEALDDVRVQATLDLLDALVQGSFGVVVEDGHALLSEDRALVDLLGHEVHGAAGHLDPVRERVAHGVPALERRQQRRMRIERPAAVRVDEGLRQDRPEAGDRDEVRVVALEDVDDLVGVRHPVEGRAEVGSRDALVRDTRVPRDLERAAVTIRDDDRDGKLTVEQGPQDRPAARSKNPDAHSRHASPGLARRLGGVRSPRNPRLTDRKVFHCPGTKETHVADEKTPSTAEIIVMAAGGVALIASFLHFIGETSSWGTGLFPIATLVPVYLIVMAAAIALTRFAGVELPNEVGTLTGQQIHLALGFFASLMALCWLITSDHRGIGLWLLVIASLAAVFGAYRMTQEHEPGTAG